MKEINLSDLYESDAYNKFLDSARNNTLYVFSALRNLNDVTEIVANDKEIPAVAGAVVKSVGNGKFKMIFPEKTDFSSLEFFFKLLHENYHLVYKHFRRIEDVKISNKADQLLWWMITDSKINDYLVPLFPKEIGEHHVLTKTISESLQKIPWKYWKKNISYLANDFATYFKKRDDEITPEQDELVSTLSVLFKKLDSETMYEYCKAVLVDYINDQPKQNQSGEGDGKENQETSEEQSGQSDKKSKSSKKEDDKDSKGKENEIEESDQDSKDDPEKLDSTKKDKSDEEDKSDKKTSGKSKDNESNEGDDEENVDYSDELDYDESQITSYEGEEEIEQSIDKNDKTRKAREKVCENSDVKDRQGTKDDIDSFSTININASVESILDASAKVAGIVDLVISHFKLRDSRNDEQWHNNRRMAATPLDLPVVLEDTVDCGDGEDTKKVRVYLDVSYSITKEQLEISAALINMVLKKMNLERSSVFPFSGSVKREIPAKKFLDMFRKGKTPFIGGGTSFDNVLDHIIKTNNTMDKTKYVVVTDGESYTSNFSMNQSLASKILWLSFGSMLASGVRNGDYGEVVEFDDGCNLVLD